MYFNRKIYAICVFYSRIVLKKLKNQPKNNFRELEKEIKHYYKIKADIDFYIRNRQKIESVQCLMHKISR